MCRWNLPNSPISDNTESKLNSIFCIIKHTLIVYTNNNTTIGSTSVYFNILNKVTKKKKYLFRCKRSLPVRYLLNQQKVNFTIFHYRMKQSKQTYGSTTMLKWNELENQF